MMSVKYMYKLSKVLKRFVCMCVWVTRNRRNSLSKEGNHSIQRGDRKSLWWWPRNRRGIKHGACLCRCLYELLPVKKKKKIRGERERRKRQETRKGTRNSSEWALVIKKSSSKSNPYCSSCLSLPTLCVTIYSLLALFEMAERQTKAANKKWVASPFFSFSHSVTLILRPLSSETHVPVRRMWAGQADCCCYCCRRRRRRRCCCSSCLCDGYRCLMWRSNR